MVLYFFITHEDYERMSHGNILHKVNNAVTPLYAFTDNLGSVTRLYTETGVEKFRAQYDPWGVQVVNRNDVNFARGYCCHEMLNDFQLINMNGRMYDPVLGRFLSPDNYVQMPTSAQSFNRYSYCLNNPLKYVDPNGEWFGIDDLIAALVGGTLNVLVNAFSGDIHSFGQGLSLFGVDALAGWLAEYGGPVTSSIILSGGNSFVNQGFNKGFDNIAIDDILYSIGMSLITTGLSSQLSNMVSPIMEKIPHLTSPILDQMLRQGFWYSVSGFTLETISSLSNGESISIFLRQG